MQAEMEFNSLLVHSEYFMRSASCLEPGASHRSRALCLLEEVFSPIRCSVPDDFDCHRIFLRAISRLDHTSSPGYPYMLEAPTIGDWLKVDGLSMDERRVSTLWNDVQLVLSGNWKLILKVFIKREPTKIKKIEQNRWRLIFCSPLCVQVAWHMLFSEMNDLEIEKTYDLPSRHGMSLQHGHWKTHMRVWRSLGFDCGLDKTAWDWTVPFWKIMDAFHLRRRLMSGRRLEEWSEVAERLYRQMFESPTLLLSDGRLYVQTHPGVMKSGCVNTISDNGKMQLIDHIIACIRTGMKPWPLPHTCGDDTLQRLDTTPPFEAYAALGAIVKSVSTGLEFVGHDFCDKGPQPLYVLKHIAAALAQPSDNIEQFMDSMLLLYVHSRLWWFWYELAWRMGLKVRSREAYLAIYDE